MMNDTPEDQNLDRLLEEWNPPFHPDPSLQNRMKHRIDAVKAEKNLFGVPPQSAKRFSLPWYLAISVAAALIVFGFIMGDFYSRSNESPSAELALLYRSSIDPVYRLTIEGKFDQRTLPIAKTVSWLETELSLSALQTNDFEALHRSYYKILASRYTELKSLKYGYKEFDNIRKSTDLIDFIALYELLEKQRLIRMKSIEETNSLIRSVLEILNDEQQNRFDRLIQAPHSPFNSHQLPLPNA